MRISEHWLREWVHPEATTRELADRLTMAGLEVDAIEPAAPAFSGVVVGEVLAVEPHPDADKLRLCRVAAGADEPLQIVCGAGNVRAGLKAPLATVGAVLPDGTRISRGRLRGVESLGMLCSARELGLDEDAGGLLELPPDAETGQDLRACLDLDDSIIEIDLTPNRGDCLGMRGVAREVGVLYDLAVNEPAVEPVPADPEAGEFPVRVEAASACPRYLGRVIRGIDRSRPSPGWLRERLRRAGIRPIDPVVDVTNYLLVELGQPMHAFDLAKLDGAIEVRLPRDGERLELLDGRTVEVTADTLVIADGRGPVALAGVMGGAQSAVGEGTSDLFLECAYFDPRAIAGRARQYGLQTDSSYRFERGVDPSQQREAMERATRLILDLAGGRAGPIIEAVSEADLPHPEPIRLRRTRVARVLGLEIAAAEIERILHQLGMQPRVDGADAWVVVPPPARFDLRLEIDLIEELARIHGYQEIPERLPQAAMCMPAVPETSTPAARLADLLVDLGFHEAITYSFVDPQDQALFDPEAAPETLENPIAADMAVMRTSLWPGLVAAAAHNLKRQIGRACLFELGRRFRRQENELEQEICLAGVLVGTRVPEQWGQPDEPFDYYDVKGIVEQLVEAAGRGADLAFQGGRHPALHPGQAAEILIAGAGTGWLGQLHPRLAGRYKLPKSVFLFELRLEALQQRPLPGFSAVSRFPAVRRDLSLEVPEGVTAAQLCAGVRGALGERLVELRLFDVYQGEAMERGKKSIGLGLILQDPSRTLEDIEVDEAMAAVLSTLARDFAIKLRA